MQLTSRWGIWGVLGLFPLLSLGLGACASGPRVEYSSGTDAHAKVAQLRERLSEDKTKQYDLIAPDTFARAGEKLRDAQDRLEKNKSSEDILASAGEAEGSLKEVDATAARYADRIGTVLDARRAAVRAKADATIPQKFASLDDKLKSLGRGMEKGKFDSDAAEITELERNYAELEIRSITGRELGQAFTWIEKAEKNGAEDKAKQNYDRAKVSYSSAIKRIDSSRRDPSGYGEAVDRANRDAKKLDGVMATILSTKASEAVASNLYDERMNLLQARSSLAEARQRADIEAESAATLQKQVSEMDRKKELDARIAKVRGEFRPDEAEIFRDGDKIVLRLKGMKFSTARAELPGASLATLKKVKEMLGAAPVANVTVEGHTDSIGSEERNLKLSQERAETVRDYLVTSGAVESAQVQATGFGYSKPVATNKSKAGRAANRRVDVVIDTARQEAGTAGSP
jgi:OOP family OmpA-OmpF porin